MKFMATRLLTITSATVCLLAGTAQANATVETYRHRGFGAVFGSESLTECGRTEFDVPLYVRVGFFLSTQTDQYRGTQPQPGGKITILNISYFSECTNTFSTIDGQSNFNPNNLPGVVDNSQIARDLGSAEFSATIPMALNRGDFTGITCPILATVTGSLQATEEPVTTSSKESFSSPGFQIRYKAKGARASAAGNYSINIGFTADCNVAGFSPLLTGTTNDGSISNSTDGSITITRTR